MDDRDSKRRKWRLVFAVSGAVDAMIGAAIFIFGVGSFSSDAATRIFSPWFPVLVGAAMLLFGLVMAINNFTRRDE
jgi:uncharacterized membrane protein HdeD (DUF308 family)